MQREQSQPDRQQQSRLEASNCLVEPQRKPLPLGLRQTVSGLGGVRCSEVLLPCCAWLAARQKERVMERGVMEADR